MFSFFLLSGGLMIFIVTFNKSSILCLLSLELIMILMIMMFLLWGLSNSGEKSAFLSLLFTCFMVLDSALGISLLVCTSRSSFFLAPADLV